MDSRTLRLLEDLAATLGAYLASRLVRRIWIEKQVRTAMRNLERSI